MECDIGEYVSISLSLSLYIYIYILVFTSITNIEKLIHLYTKGKISMCLRMREYGM